jgi:glycosyltransferase involved in cell wall biosynthesis
MTSIEEEVTLSVLMPCLNEARTLPACIAKAHAYLARQNFAGEIIIADNGSSDGSREIAQSMGARVISVPQRGYGSALRAGIAAARGRFIVMGDSDDSYDFGDLDLFVDRLEAGYDLVIGNRFEGGIKSGAMPLLHRYFGTPVLSALGRLLYRSPITDFHCGLRGFRRSALLQVGPSSCGMEYAIEMIVKSTIHGLRITQVPATLSPDGRDRRPHLRTWRDGWRSLRFLLCSALTPASTSPGSAPHSTRKRS